MKPQTVRILGGQNPGDANLTLSGTQYSRAWSAGYAQVWALHYQWTGTPTAAVTLWASCFPTPDLANDNDWVQDTSFTLTQPAGSAGKHLQEVGNSGAKWYRLKIVTSGGAGTITGYVNGKQ